MGGKSMRSPTLVLASLVLRGFARLGSAFRRSAARRRCADAERDQRLLIELPAGRDAFCLLEFPQALRRGGVAFGSQPFLRLANDRGLRDGLRRCLRLRLTAWALAALRVLLTAGNGGGRQQD